MKFNKENTKTILINLGLFTLSNLILSIFHVFSLISLFYSQNSTTPELWEFFFICVSTLLPILIGNLFTNFLIRKLLPQHALPLFWYIASVLLFFLHLIAHISLFSK